MSPFTSGFNYIKDVPLSIAKRIVVLLNGASKILTASSLEPHGRYCPLAPPQQCAYQASDKKAKPTTQHPLMTQQHEQAVISERDPQVFPGYTTIDDAGDDGDDTVHSPISFYHVPNVIQTLIQPPGTDPSEEAALVDLVYVDFIEPYIALAAKFSGLPVNLPADSAVYMDGTMTELIQAWIKENWKCDTSL